LVWKFLAFAAAVAVAFFMVQVVVLVISVATRGGPPAESNLAWLPGVLFFAVLLISGQFLRRFDGQPLRAIGIGFDRPWIRQMSLGILLGALMMAAVWGGLIAAGATWSFNPDWSNQLGTFGLAALMTLGIGAYEELLCRGYAMQILYRWRPAVGVIVTGLFFIAIHLGHEGGIASLSIVNMGLAHLLYVLCFLRTRSLWLGIGIHTAWNFFLAFFFGMPISGLPTDAVVFRTQMGHSLLFGNEFGPEAGLVVTGVLALATALTWILLPQRRPVPSLIDVPAAPVDVTMVARPVGMTEAHTAPMDAPMMARPVAASATLPAPAIGPQLNRFAALDILRALAVFGILAGNIQGFALHDAALLNPYGCAWTDPLNVTVWVITTGLIGYKDLMLFGMMFGAGILMVSDRCAAAGRSEKRLHIQRMAALVFVSFVHAYLIWSGDILFTYAVCGMIVFSCRQWSPRKLLLTGSVIYLVPLALLVAVYVALPRLGPEIQNAVHSAFYPSAEEVNKYYDIYRGGWLAQTPTRIYTALSQHTLLMITAMGWVAAGMMLVGMGLYRLGFLTGKQSRERYLRLFAWSAFAGLVLTGFGMWMNFRMQWRADFSLLVGRIPLLLGAVFLALATIGLVMFYFPSRAQGLLARSLAAVGQMSLTNYVGHSVIMSLIFYGSGFGLIGTMDRVQLMGVVAAICLAQMTYSPLWLAYFRYGPVEWVWRSLAYWQWQPMRRTYEIPEKKQAAIVARYGE